MGDDVRVREKGQFAPGDLLEGKYRIVRPLAEGGMGAIFHAVHEKLGRDVAVKVLKPVADETPDKLDARIQRFYREASFSSQLNHPHTMTIFDYGELTNHGGFFLVMEFLQGKSLKEVLQEQGRLDPATTLHIGCQIASSLADAHSAGVIHRDLKPPNVMLVERGGDPYFVKVVDFGLVKRLHAEDDDDDELTAENTVVGSPMYIAPERFLQKDADSPAVDIYALGILLYEMLAGRPPFTRDDGCTVHQLILKHVQQPPPPLLEICPDLSLPEGLEVLILKCLEKDPQRRIPSMDSLLSLLKSCARSLDYNPHKAISPFYDSGTFSQTQSSEILLHEETGATARLSTDDLPADIARDNLPAAEPTSQQALEQSTSRSPLVLIAGAAVVVAVLAIVALTLAPSTEEAAPSQPQDEALVAAPSDPGESAQEQAQDQAPAQEQAQEEEELAAAEDPVAETQPEPAADPAGEQTAEQAAEQAPSTRPSPRTERPATRPQPERDSSSSTPPVNIRMER